MYESCYSRDYIHRHCSRKFAPLSRANGVGGEIPLATDNHQLVYTRASVYNQPCQVAWHPYPYSTRNTDTWQNM
jgi:hypothetical protein